MRAWVCACVCACAYIKLEDAEGAACYTLLDAGLAADAVEES